MQFEMNFPEINPSDRVLVSNRRTFKAHKKNGKIFIKNTGAVAAEVYINGRLIRLGSLLQNSKESLSIDIGEYCVDGTNTIKVMGISPASAAINIKIPYPELVNGQAQEAGFDLKKLGSL